MQKRDLIKTVVLCVLIIGVTIGASLGLNLITGPKIAADKAYRDELAAQEAAGDLLKVFPGAAGFEDITSTLTIDPALRVDSVYRETSDKGYVVIARQTKGQMKDDMIVTFGVAEGKVVGLIYKLVNDKDYTVSDETVNSVIGNDSSLKGFVITASCTRSSESLKEAVANGFLVLAENDLMKAKAKETEQVFEELLPTVLPNFVKGDSIETSGNIYQAYKTKNGACLITYVNTSEGKVVAVTAMNRTTKVYKANLLNEKTQEYELVEVTDSNSAVVTEVLEFAASNLKQTTAALNNKVKSVFKLTTDELKAIESAEIAISETGNVTAAMSYVIAGEVYYAYQIKVYNPYDGSVMNTYFIFDSEGNIFYYTTGAYFFGESVHYFEPNMKFEHVDETTGKTGQQVYEENIMGKDSSTLTDEDIIIAGATYTTTAVKEIFAIALKEFATLGGNN